MAHVDFKVTIWEKVQIKDECLAEVIEKIKSGKIQSSNDLIDTDYTDGDDGNYETIAETEEQLSLEDNGGESTIEVYDDGIVYQNGN